MVAFFVIIPYLALALVLRIALRPILKNNQKMASTIACLIPLAILASLIFYRWSNDFASTEKVILALWLAIGVFISYVLLVKRAYKE